MDHEACGLALEVAQICSFPGAFLGIR